MVMLLTSQKDEIFVALQEAGLYVSNFVWDTGSSQFLKHKGSHSYYPKVPRIVHAPTNFYFQFDMNNGQHHAAYSPGAEKLFDSSATQSWKNQTTYFQKWSTYLLCEINAPDLWKALETSQLPSGANENLAVNENTPFSDVEKAETRAQLDEIRDYLFNTAELSAVNQKRVAQQLEYLGKATERLGRIDWRGLFVGTVMSWVLSGIVPPDTAQDFVGFALRAIQSVLDNLPMLPG